MATIITQDANLAWSGVRLALLKERCQAMFEQLARVAGVQGACVCDNHGVILGLLLAGVGDRRLFERIGLGLSQCLGALHARSAVRDLEVVFERKTVVARDLGNATLAVVCSADANLPLLRMTLNVAANPFEGDAELQRGLKQAALSRGNTLSGEHLDALARSLLQRAGVRAA
jgi:predicted regulator of Ras-like GTPase activity (Roadblock/LC7/MglB family)